jgi:glycosyltransferase involved in cell wall biosynthesis
VTAPGISIVVPCFNGGAFLDRLMASLAGQTYRAFELIIVDDGSTDPFTREKLAAAEGVVIRQDNRGLAAARNAGFRAARAPLVLPLDCDDTLEPTFLAETRSALASASAETGFVFCDQRLTGTLEGALERRCNGFEQLFLNQLPYCMLMRKAAWEAVGGYDESMRDGYEDWEFNIRLLRAGIRGDKIAKPLFVYHVSQDGMLMSRSSRLHGRIWRRIRRKHRDLYRLPALVRRWRAARGHPSKVGMPVAAGLLLLDRLLPERWFGWLFHRLLTSAHRRRLARGELRAPDSARGGLLPAGPPSGARDA